MQIHFKFKHYYYGREKAGADYEKMKTVIMSLMMLQAIKEKLKNEQ